MTMEVRFRGLCENSYGALTDQENRRANKRIWRSVSSKEWPKKNVQTIMRGNIFRGGRSIELYKVRR